MSDFAQRVEDVVASLGPAEVVSYGEVARQAGHPGAARAVGTALRRAERPLPWWRVVAADGRLAPHLADEQSRRLRDEGVHVLGDRVVLPRV